MAHISIDDLSVQFAIFGANARSMKNLILSQATGGRIMAGARDVVSVRAIDGLSLEIRHGDRIGLVGHNGAGKTTLLRVLAGIYKPTSGTVRVEGKVATLLAPMAGMEPDATGYENIMLRGNMLGMRRAEIQNQIEDIASFTELGDFLGLPMRTYSAGMQARLAFAISTSVKSDILLIDEAIGAGDKSFQEKAQERIAHLFSRTAIVILASHSPDLIARFCNRKVEMHAGRLVGVTPIEPPAALEAAPAAG